MNDRTAGSMFTRCVADLEPGVSDAPFRARPEKARPGLPSTCEDLDHGQSVMEVELYEGGSLGYCYRL